MRPSQPAAPSKPEHLVDAYNFVWKGQVLQGAVTAGQLEKVQAWLPPDWTVIHCTKASGYHRGKERPSEIASDTLAYTLAGFGA